MLHVYVKAPGGFPLRAELQLRRRSADALRRSSSGFNRARSVELPLGLQTERHCKRVADQSTPRSGHRLLEALGCARVALLTCGNQQAAAVARELPCHRCGDALEPVHRKAAERIREACPGILIIQRDLIAREAIVKEKAVAVPRSGAAALKPAPEFGTRPL